MYAVKLTDLPRVLLTTAAQRPDGNLLPFPETMTGPVPGKTISSLIKRAFIKETIVTAPAPAWREDKEGYIGLMITTAGRAAVGQTVNTGIGDVPAPAAAAGLSKIGTVVAMLRREGGATLAELVDATGWLPHTTRAALTGLRKKGHAIAKGKRDDVTCYTLAAVA